MPHHHHHDHAPTSYNNAFALGVVLNVVYILVEVGYGLMAGSLALLADAGHNLSDVLGLLLAWGAAYLNSVQPSSRRTYGWRSTSILAAMLNGLILLVAVGGIVWEAIDRFWAPQPVTGSTVIWVSAVGVLVNGVTAMLFFRGRKDDLNVKGAFLHMAADAAVSLGVVLAGAAILWTGKTWIDPTISLVVAAVVFWSTWGLLKDSTNLALQSVPVGINPDEVAEYLLSLTGVVEVHDLHIWAMSTTETALTAHLVKPSIENEDRILHGASHTLHERFRIDHMTIQFERSSDHCHQASPESL